MSRSSFVAAALIASLLACKQKPGAQPPEADASASGPTTVSVPIPPEPPPPQAAKAAEVPDLEAKLAADKAYQAAWTANHENERAILLTAMSDMIAYGTTHSDTEAAAKRAELTDTVMTLNKIVWRTGKLPADFTTKLEAYLSASKTAPHLGVWAVEEKGKPLFDATALAMWLHPNDPGYVRERVRALLKGPFPAQKNTPVARAWVAQLGDVVNRLTALGAFRKEDCVELGARWSEKVAANGQTQYACEPAEKPFVIEGPSVVGAWDQVIRNSSMPNSVASDTMRHVFRPDGTVTVRMDEAKPATFKWTFEQGKHFVAYKYGQFDHRREFRLRSADEAEVVESNGKVLDTFVREGSPLAQKKSAVALFTASKNVTDVSALAIGRSYVLDRQTPLMPDPDPADPTAALALMKQVPAGSTFSILAKRIVSGKPWYQVRTTVDGTVTGWFNSIALAGQDLAPK